MCKIAVSFSCFFNELRYLSNYFVYLMQYLVIHLCIIVNLCGSLWNVSLLTHVFFHYLQVSSNMKGKKGQEKKGKFQLSYSIECHVLQRYNDNYLFIKNIETGNVFKLELIEMGIYTICSFIFLCWHITIKGEEIQGGSCPWNFFDNCSIITN